MQLHAVGTGRAEHLAARLLLVASVPVVFASLPARSYGPGNCVSITRADGGTCQISTNCATQDLSSFDFTFLCVTRPAGQEMHSLGVGSFDQVEEFDTDVHCDQCLPPAVPHAAKPEMQAALSAVRLAHKERGQVPVRRAAVHTVHPLNKSTAATVVESASKKTAARAKLMVPVPEASNAFLAQSSHRAPSSVQEGIALFEKPKGHGASRRHRAKEAQTKAAEDSLDDKEQPSSESSESAAESGDDVPAQAERYGPASCVAVWRNVSSGSCVMQTDCDQPSSLSIYEFGLVCVDKADKMTKHVFGMDSFKLKERFDTLIECRECRALDEYMNGDKALKQLAQQVQEMEGDLESVSKGVTRLNAEVMEEKKEEAANATNGSVKMLTRQKKDVAEETQKEEVVETDEDKAQEGADEEVGNAEESDDEEAKEGTPATVGFLRQTPFDSHVRYAEEKQEREEGEEAEEQVVPAADMEEGEEAEEDAEEVEDDAEEASPATVGFEEHAPPDVPARYSEEAEEVRQEAAPAAEGDEKEEATQEASPIKLGFLRQARHRHPHQQYEVRRVHRRHHEVKQQELDDEKSDEVD